MSKHNKQDLAAMHILKTYDAMLEALKGFIEYYEAYNSITDKRIEPYIKEAKHAIAQGHAQTQATG